MIPIKRLTIGMQYWFVCENIKVFGRYNGHDKNVLKISDAFVYFIKSSYDKFSIEQYYIMDSRALTNIKIDDSAPDEDFSAYYSNEIL